MSSYPITAKVREYYYDDEPETITDPEKVESRSDTTYSNNFDWFPPNQESKFDLNREN